MGNEAMILCMGCEVRAECKAYKEKSKSRHGIWAGVLSKRNEKS